MSEDSPAAVARTLAARCPVIGPTAAPCEPLAAIVGTGGGAGVGSQLRHNNNPELCRLEIRLSPA